MIHSTSSSTTTTSHIPAFTTSTTTTTSATSSTSTSEKSIIYEDNLLIDKLEYIHHTILPLYKRLSSYLLPSSLSSSNNNKNTLSKATKIAILYQICSIGVKIILMIIEIINDYENRYRHEMIIYSNRLTICMKKIVDEINDSMSMLKSIINLKKYNAFDYVDELIKMFSEDSRLQHSSYISSISSLPSTSAQTSSSLSSSYALTSSLYNQLLHRSWYLIAAAIAGLRECRRVENFDFKSVNRISTVISCLKRQGLVHYVSSSRGSDGSTETTHAKDSNNSYEQPYHHHHHQNQHQINQRKQISSSLFQPEWLNELLSQVGIHEISYTSSLEELSKLFPRRLPQIVALWCVETPITYWDKVSIFMNYLLSIYIIIIIINNNISIIIIFIV